MTIQNVFISIFIGLCFFTCCNGQVLISKDLIGQFTMGSRLSGPSSSPLSESPYSSSLTIRSDGTYTAGSWCFPINGKYSYSNDEIILEAGVSEAPRCFYSSPVTTDEAEKGTPPPKDRKLQVIRWSGRVYLLVENDWESFANAINAGLLPQTQAEGDLYLGSFYRRVGDEAKDVFGRPELPAEKKALILDKPIEVKIIHVQKNRDYEWVAIADKGSRNGLRKGMLFFSPKSESVWLSNGYVRSVSDGTAELVFFSDLKVNDILSTKFGGTIK